jgi:thioesterase domain-containing protein
MDLEDIFEEGDFDEEERRIIEIHLRAWQNYTVYPYPGRLLLICSRTRPLFHSLEPDLGWSRIALGGVDKRVIPGHHLSILEEPYIQYLAMEVEEALEGR